MSLTILMEEEELNIPSNCYKLKQFTFFQQNRRFDKTQSFCISIMKVYNIELASSCIKILITFSSVMEININCIDG